MEDSNCRGKSQVICLTRQITSESLSLIEDQIIFILICFSVYLFLNAVLNGLNNWPTEKQENLCSRDALIYLWHCVYHKLIFMHGSHSSWVLIQNVQSSGLWVIGRLFTWLSVAVSGFGGCVDIVVDGVSLLDKAGVLPTDQPLHHDIIKNGEQLAQSFAYFFPPGAASE